MELERIEMQRNIPLTKRNQQIDALIARLIRELDHQAFLIELLEQKRLELLRKREEAA